MRSIWFPECVGGDPVILLIPLIPLLRMFAAAPAGNSQDAFTVAQAQETVGFYLPLELDRVQIHVLYIEDLGQFPFGIRPEKHVWGQPSAMNQDTFAVDLVDAIVFIAQFGTDLPDAEANSGSVGNLAVHFNRQV